MNVRCLPFPRLQQHACQPVSYTHLYVYKRQEEKESPLPPLAEGETVTPTGFAPLQHFTQPPARYTDATLIRTMEENGIGRPSTYAPTVLSLIHI